MFDEQARAFLQKPLTARFATNDPSGYPHVVPVWFKLEGDEIVMVSERVTRKMRNLQANPKASLSIGGDPGDDAGYLIRVEVNSISDDVNHALTNRLTYHYESKEEADKHVVEWIDLDQVALRLKVISVVKVY